jgi:hypothetical protein
MNPPLLPPKINTLAGNTLPSVTCGNFVPIMKCLGFCTHRTMEGDSHEHRRLVPTQVEAF